MKNYFKITIIIVFSIALFNFINVIKINAAQNLLATCLKGRFLLQVQYDGQIWYVNTDNLKRYLVTKKNAINIFRSFALGITNADLDKIPTNINSLEINKDSDNDGYLDKTEAQFNYNLFNNGKAKFDKILINKLKGKLLLQVENNGRIWYVNPVDEKKYEIRTSNVLNLFRSLSLGITNNDLAEIPIGEIKIQGNKVTSNQTAEGISTPTSTPKTTVTPSPITYYNTPTNNNSSSPSQVITTVAGAINNGNNAQTLLYFTVDMKPSIEYTLNILDNNDKKLFTDILIDASLTSNELNKKVYTTILPFNDSYGKIDITLEKQDNDEWLISSL